MHWRPIREADLLQCLETQPACIGDRTVGRAAALRIWRDLLENPAFNANVIESEGPRGGRRIVGCGMGVFVDPVFADRELAAPQAGLIKPEILSSTVADRSGRGPQKRHRAVAYVRRHLEELRPFAWDKVR